MIALGREILLLPTRPSGGLSFRVGDFHMTLACGSCHAPPVAVCKGSSCGRRSIPLENAWRTHTLRQTGSVQPVVYRKSRFNKLEKGWTDTGCLCRRHASIGRHLCSHARTAGWCSTAATRAACLTPVHELVHSCSSTRPSWPTCMSCAMLHANLHASRHFVDLMACHPISPRD